MPEGKVNWDDLTAHQQARLLAYDQISTHDHDEMQASLAGAKFGKK